MRIYDVVMMGTTEDSLNPYYEPQEDPTFLAEAMLCEIIDIVMDAKTAFLFDLRGSLFTHHIDPRWNVAFIVCSNVIEKQQDFWFQKLRPHRSVYHIGDCHVKIDGDQCVMDIDHNIKVVCRKIEFYLGHVSHIENVARSLDGSLEEFLTTTPHWESEIELLGYSRVQADWTPKSP